MIEKAVTSQQAAEFLEITVNTLREYRYLGVGPPYYVLPGINKGEEKRQYNSVRYLLSDLLNWLKEKRERPNPKISGFKRRKRVKYEARKLMRKS